MEQYEAIKHRLEAARMVQRGIYSYCGQWDRQTDQYYILHYNLTTAKKDAVSGPYIRKEFDAALDQLIETGEFNDSPSLPEEDEEPTEIKEEAKNKIDDADLCRLELWLCEDEIEDIHQYCVNWRGLCGYFNVSLECETAEEARTLFKALQAVNDIEAS